MTFESIHLPSHKLVNWHTFARTIYMSWVEKCQLYVSKVNEFRGGAYGSEWSQHCQRMVSTNHSQKPTEVSCLCQLLQEVHQGLQLYMNPLTSMLRKLRWIMAAEQFFTQLKEALTTAPILRHSDPLEPFMVEVDASETWVCVVLSWKSGDRQTPTCGILLDETFPQWDKLWHR